MNSYSCEGEVLYSVHNVFGSLNYSNWTQYILGTSIFKELGMINLPRGKRLPLLSLKRCCVLFLALAVMLGAGSSSGEELTEEMKDKLASGEKLEGMGYRLEPVGTDISAMTYTLAAKIKKEQAKGAGGKAAHLVMILDSSTAMRKHLEALDEACKNLFKYGPKGMQVSVVALRAKPELVEHACVDSKSLRLAVRRVITLAKESQTRAKLKMNPAQRLMMRGEEGVFLSVDDCIKDWCGGVKFSFDELWKDYPFSAALVMTMHNPDTENHLEEIVGQLKAKKVTFFAAAPDTLLSVSDIVSEADRWKSYEACKAGLGIDYGAEFLFHRRESAINEVVSVTGLNGAHECVPCPTGWGYYGLARGCYATGGTYFILDDFSRPECACMFHRPGERLVRGAAPGPQKPPPLPWFQNNKNGPRYREIKPFEFDEQNQVSLGPCLKSRTEAFGVYGASPWWQYHFSITGINAGYGNQNYGLANNAGGRRHWGRSAKGHYRVWLVTHWDGVGAGKGKGKVAVKGKGEKASDSQADTLDPLRIFQWTETPGAWQFKGQLGRGHHSSFYTMAGLLAAQEWLKGAEAHLDAQIKQIKEGMPKGKPGQWDHRAIANIKFFILCLENNRFYVNQYLHYLGILAKDPGALAILGQGKDEEAAREKARAARQAGKGKAGQGMPYVDVIMPRLLKQRCEDFNEVMGVRIPIYGGGMGQMAVNRFRAEFTAMDKDVGLSTWTNFFQRGWQRQYHYVIRRPSWGGPGGRRVKPKIPKPPRYQPPSGPTTPEY